jgi:hypothetical protein
MIIHDIFTTIYFLHNSVVVPEHAGGISHGLRYTAQEGCIEDQSGLGLLVIEVVVRCSYL